MVEITEKDNSHIINLRIGEKFKLTLPENRTTAFKWEEKVSSESHIIQLEGDNYLASTSTDVLGGRGIHEWLFTVVGIGQKKLKFIYKRPGERDSANAKTFEITVNVTDQ